MPTVKFEYEFWNVAQLQAVGLTPEFASSFNYFVRDVSKINTNTESLEVRIKANEDAIVEINDDLDNLTARVVVNEGNISTLQLEMDVVQIVSTNNANRLDVLEPRVSQNEADILNNFDYLNGVAKPAAYSSSLAYSKKDVITNGNTEEVCVTDNAAGPKNPDDWRKIGVADNAGYIIDIIQALIDDYQYVAYGGLYIDTPPVAFADIDATWDDLDIFDSPSFATPKHITQSLVNNSLAINKVGVYEFTLNLVFSHDEDNAGRTTYIRLYNLTDAAATSVLIPVFIARNQPGTNFSYSFPFELTDALDENKELILQIGGGDDVASISFDTAEYYIKSIGEYRGEIL